MEARWYVLHTKPRKEEVAWRQLLDRGFKAVYPRLFVRPVNARSGGQRPLFPGYIFVRVDLCMVSLSTFQWMPHAHGLVAFDDVPAAVPDALVAEIEQRVAALNRAIAAARDRMPSGNPGAIRSRPHRDYDTMFESGATGKSRVRALMGLLNNQRRPA